MAREGERFPDRRLPNYLSIALRTQPGHFLPFKNSDNSDGTVSSQVCARHASAVLLICARHRRARELWARHRKTFQVHLTSGATLAGCFV